MSLIQSSPSVERARRYIGWYLGILLFVISFGGGVLVGRTWNQKHSAKALSNEVAQSDVTQVFNIDRSTIRTNAVDFNQFWQIWDEIKQKYVKQQTVNDSDLFYGAIQGMVAGLGDPYSIYFPPQPAKEFAKSLEGELNGIGAEIGVKNNQIVIIAPLPDTPAAKAGLRPGDKILAIDKKITLGMDVNTAVTKIRGQAGTTTTLTIGREGVAKPTDITIMRAKINVPSVVFSMKPGNIAYFRIMQFNDETDSLFSRYIDEALAKNAKGVILDLRNNPGGYLDSAVYMASEWAANGSKIVSERFSDGHENIHQSGGTHRLQKMKTMVLVNGGSASASEIVAGALQDYGLATIIGEKTFGKGSVQNLEPLPDGSALKLTVAEWYTPNGNNINQKGVAPDVAVKEDFEKEKIGQDVMVSKALQLFKK